MDEHINGVCMCAFLSRLESFSMLMFALHLHLIQISVLFCFNSIRNIQTESDIPSLFDDHAFRKCLRMRMTFA